MYGIERQPTIVESLKRVGLAPEDISLVINTHLHFDHCGGNTAHDSGATVPAFPKASYVIQRGEYEDSVGINERTRASYRSENIAPLVSSRQWEFAVGDTELLPGISVILTPGHTRHHQSVRVESEGQVLFFLGDLIPTVSHLPLPYLMGYDLYPLQTLETKRWVLDRAFEEGWLLVFEHDPKVQMGRVKRDVEGKYYLQEVRA
jgi:glyoxylase-like metal-dependent hydrolase (beta-lactamase superfamily II)